LAAIFKIILDVSHDLAVGIHFYLQMAAKTLANATKKLKVCLVNNRATRLILTARRGNLHMFHEREISRSSIDGIDRPCFE